MIISDVAIFVMQQQFLRTETKLIQPLSLTVLSVSENFVVHIIHCLRTTNNLEKYENHIFSTRLAIALDLSSLYE